MSNHHTDPDPDFCLPSSSSFPTAHHHENPRRKRTKLVPCTTTTTTISKPKYYKKPDPSAPKITRPCTECGKKFWSWKALFGHMRCHPERQWRGINPPPKYRRPVSPIQEATTSTTTTTTTTTTANVDDIMTAEDHEVASYLLLLAHSDGAATELESHDFRGVVVGGIGASSPQVQDHDQENCRFECSSCKKVFGSHQALGGHRASHKNVKGCFAITRSDGFEVADLDLSGNVDMKENVEVNYSNSKMLMMLGHKCSICLRVFSSGQALGGHKRCHWEKGSEEASTSMNHHQGLHVYGAKEGCGLDLNLPAPVEDESSCSFSSGLTLDLRLGL